MFNSLLQTEHKNVGDKVHFQSSLEYRDSYLSRREVDHVGYPVRYCFTTDTLFLLLYYHRPELLLDIAHRLTYKSKLRLGGPRFVNVFDSAHVPSEQAQQGGVQLRGVGVLDVPIAVSVEE